MSLADSMKNGKIYRESGFTDQTDIDYAKQLAVQRLKGKQLAFEFNQTNPTNEQKRQALMKQLFHKIGKRPFIEGPLYTSYGCHTTIGDDFYANFNLTIVDDIDVTIGDHVMCGPNVMISVTGHPLEGPRRRNGEQFSKPVHIGNDVWIGGNVAILPGVSIGNNVVIGAGSVVTRSVPDNVVVVGVPGRITKKLPPVREQI